MTPSPSALRERMADAIGEARVEGKPNRETKVKDWLCRADLLRAADAAISSSLPVARQAWRTFTLDREIMICGVRYERGTYAIKRVDDDKTEPAF